METSHQSVSNKVQDVIQIGKWTFFASVFRLEQGQEVIKLEPRVAQLLSYLAANAGKLVNRETLMDEVWPGMVVGDEALTNAINKLRKAFSDDRQNPQVIETIPKAGYRLIADVKPINSPRPHIDEEPSSQNTSSDKQRWLTRNLLIITPIALTIIIFALWIAIGTDDKTIQPSTETIALSAKPSIAVLPFYNLGEDSEQDYFVDGITDNLITGLAKDSELLVISRESTFLYKHQPLDAYQIAEELGVSHILNGSVLREDGNIKIKVQLIDAKTGGHLWVKDYDTPVQDIFILQDDITQKVSSILTENASIGAQQDFGTPHTSNFQAYDSFLNGRQRFYLFSNKADNQKSREYFQKAIGYDSDFAMAYAMLAWTHVFDVMNGWSPVAEDSLKLAREMAEKATFLQNDIPVAYFVKGLTYRENGEYMSALVEAQKAIEYDPNYANAHVLLATLLYYAGRPQEGLERINKAIQLNPHHPYNYTFHLGQAHYILRHYEEAIVAFRKGISNNPTSERLHLWLTASYAQIGDIDKANWEVEQILILNPEFSLERLQHSFPFKHQSDRDHFLNGLRKAGLN